MTSIITDQSIPEKKIWIDKLTLQVLTRREIVSLFNFPLIALSRSKNTNNPYQEGRTSEILVKVTHDKNNSILKQDTTLERICSKTTVLHSGSQMSKLLGS